MEYTITPLTPHTGAEVRGIDLKESVDAETRTALNRTFAERHVVVVRGQQFNPPQFIAAAQIFGELFQHDKREMHVPGYPQIYYVSNEQTVPGKRYISGESFHTDHSNHDCRRGRRAQSHAMAELADLASPVVCASIELGFDALSPSRKDSRSNAWLKSSRRLRGSCR
jgi:taurine dioxygenase